MTAASLVSFHLISIPCSSLENSLYTRLVQVRYHHKVSCNIFVGNRSTENPLYSAIPMFIEADLIKFPDLTENGNILNRIKINISILITIFAGIV
ncbi:MAG: hypothetical protein PHC39_10165, partial [Proteiniphilum sp.]|nr:hypothetical protein [Proteiniphilum sp.]